MKKKIAVQSLRTFAEIVLMIILCTVLFAGSIYFSVGLFATDADVYISVADKAQEENDFYSDMYENVCQRLVSRGTLGGFPKEIFDGILEYDYAVSSFKDYVRFIVDSPDKEFELSEFDEKLRKVCVDYASSAEAEEVNFSATEEEIDTFVDYIDSQLVAIIALPFFSDVYPFVYTIYQPKIVFIAVFGLILSTAVIFGIICLIEKGKMKNAFRQVLYSLSGAGTMTLVCGIFLAMLNGNEFFSFSSQAVLDYLNIFKSFISRHIIVFGAVTVVIGVGLMVCIMIFSDRKKSVDDKKNEKGEIGENSPM